MNFQKQIEDWINKPIISEISITQWKSLPDSDTDSTSFSHYPILTIKKLEWRKCPEGSYPELTIKPTGKAREANLNKVLEFCQRYGLKVREEFDGGPILKIYL